MLPDYAHIRASRTCPLCNQSKDQGLVACWPCYRRDLKHGESRATTLTLETVEQRLIERQAQGSDYDGALDENDRRARRPWAYRRD